jgi:hypothetical protein
MEVTKGSLADELLEYQDLLHSKYGTQPLTGYTKDFDMLQRRVEDIENKLTWLELRYYTGVANG